MIVLVKHSIGGQRRSNRVKVESSDPAMCGAEICLALAETYQVDPRDVIVEDVQADPGDPGYGRPGAR